MADETRPKTVASAAVSPTRTPTTRARNPPSMPTARSPASAGRIPLACADVANRMTMPANKAIRTVIAEILSGAVKTSGSW